MKLYGMKWTKQKKNERMTIYAVPKNRWSNKVLMYIKRNYTQVIFGKKRINWNDILKLERRVIWPLLPMEIISWQMRNLLWIIAE